MAKADLLQWAVGELSEKAKLAYAGEGEFCAGEHCKFCKAKAVCRKRAEYNLELAKYDFEMPATLEDTGWQRLDEWTGGKIACWNPSGETVSFQKSNALVFPYEGIMYEYCDKRIDQISTPEHKMYVKRRYGGEWLIDTVENMEKYRPSIPFTGYRQTTAGLEHSILRVLVMVQADGCFTEDGSVVLAFTKLRKVERCKTLLRAADVSFVYGRIPPFLSGAYYL